MELLEAINVLDVAIRECGPVRETLPLFLWNFRRRTLRESSSGVQLPNNLKSLSNSHTDLSIGRLGIFFPIRTSLRTLIQWDYLPSQGRRY